MQIVTTAAALRGAIAAFRAAGETVALVPTMGNLHAGHLALVERARAEARRVVATVFVNPTQFGPGEDFTAYPRTLSADADRLGAAGCDLLFAPSEAVMYPDGAAQATRVEVPDLSTTLCGAFRPGHFAGVTSVVARLFNLAGADVAVFGEKDYQQLTVIRRMARDLHLTVRIVGVPTVREPDGLALSSRNQYLTPAERAVAPRLAAVLGNVADQLAAGRRDLTALEAGATAALTAAGFRPDYVAVRRLADLAVPVPGSQGLVVLGAAHLGRARLIDNRPLPELTL